MKAQFVFLSILAVSSVSFAQVADVTDTTSPEFKRNIQRPKVTLNDGDLIKCVAKDSSTNTETRPLYLNPKDQRDSRVSMEINFESATISKHGTSVDLIIGGVKVKSVSTENLGAYVDIKVANTFTKKTTTYSFGCEGISQASAVAEQLNRGNKIFSGTGELNPGKSTAGKMPGVKFAAGGSDLEMDAESAPAANKTPITVTAPRATRETPPAPAQK